MNRRSFFKFLGIGAATAVVAPTIIPKLVEEKEKSWKIFGYNPFRWTRREINIPGIKISGRRLKAQESYRSHMDEEIRVGEIKRNV
jgi:hypothetical protein